MSIASAGRIRVDMCSSLVCLDASSEYEMSGRVFHLYLEEKDTFPRTGNAMGQMKGRVYRSFLELVDVLDEIYDRLDYPQNSVEYRKFTEGQEKDLLRENVEENSSLSGLEATFLVRVLFRQNASWQGSVQWMEKNQTENFRSVMEFMKLIRSTTKNTHQLHDSQESNSLQKIQKAI